MLPARPPTDTTIVPPSIRKQIGDVLAGIRIPDLPYPASIVSPEAMTDWRPGLQACWDEQRDHSVVHVINTSPVVWTVLQVNASYLADQIMDAYLEKSCLHPVLVKRIARLRFLLAWRMTASGTMSFDDSISRWLDSLAGVRGWSDSGGRSSRALLGQMDAMVSAVSECFQTNSLAPFDRFSADWVSDLANRQSRAGMLHERLLQTEQGASRQRYAEQAARAAVGRALVDRRLPMAIARFILDCWFPLLRHITLQSGVESSDWKHAHRLLQWLVWIGDPNLSDQNKGRLYQVGEQLGNLITEVWQRTYTTALSTAKWAPVEQAIVARLRGDSLDLRLALSQSQRFEFDVNWFEPVLPRQDEIDSNAGQWFVKGEGAEEQRRFFLDVLADTGEIVWTNGAGVKLGLMSWSEFKALHESGTLRVLPPLAGFLDILTGTVISLSAIFVRQRKQREDAAKASRAKAEALREQIAQVERARKEKEALRLEAIRAQEAALVAERKARQETERQRQLKELQEISYSQVNGLALGGWVSITTEAAKRYKLAVRINASRKLIFVDKLGLNRLEYSVEELTAAVVAGDVKVLGGAVEFEDSLSEVVGRIRVSQNEG